MIKVERIYQTRPKHSAYHILVDGIWPRGIKKQDPRVDEWFKQLAPSRELRKWFAHDPEKWGNFQYFYRRELEGNKDMIRKLLELEQQHGEITLIYSAKDEKHNQALVLKEFLEEQRARQTDSK